MEAGGSNKLYAAEQVSDVEQGANKVRELRRNVSDLRIFPGPIQVKRSALITPAILPASRISSGFYAPRDGMVAVIGIVAMVTASAFYALVANDDLLTRLICVAGGLMVGAKIGMAILVSLFANPITRKVCGVSDTRLLR